MTTIDTGGSVAPEYARALLRLLHVADDIFKPRQREEKIAWLQEQMRGLHIKNFEWLPDFIETPLENLAIEAGAEIGEALLSGRIRKGGKVGPALMRSLLHYVDMAEDMFPLDQQAEAKEWVREQLHAVAASHDIKWLWDPVERTVERVFINIGVDLTWEFLHSARLRTTLRAMAAS